MSMEATLHVLKYIGGKGRMAGVLSRLIPSTCKVYAEMYCGSAALALNSGKFDVKILNDFNPHIANFVPFILRVDEKISGDLTNSTVNFATYPK